MSELLILIMPFNLTEDLFFFFFFKYIQVQLNPSYSQFSNHGFTYSPFSVGVNTAKYQSNVFVFFKKTFSKQYANFKYKTSGKLKYRQL